MSRACLVLLAALWSACESSQLPPPSILAVEPAQFAAGQSVELRLRIDALLSGTMDYEQRSVASGPLASQVQVWVGSVQVPLQRYEEGGVLVVSVPENLTEGAYDVRLVLEDGREALLTRALTVTVQHKSQLPGSGTPPGASPPDAGPTNPGDPTDGALRGFRMDTLGEQVRNVPFLVVLRAEGPQATAFQGMVKLGVNKGTIEPAVAGPFVDGVATVRVTLVVPAGPSVIITAEDDQGHQGHSNPFWVRPN